MLIHDEKMPLSVMSYKNLEEILIIAHFLSYYDRTVAMYHTHIIVRIFNTVLDVSDFAINSTVFSINNTPKNNMNNYFLRS